MITYKIDPIHMHHQYTKSQFPHNSIKKKKET